MIRPISLLAPLLAGLAACAPAGNEPGPGGVTIEEARALDEAAAMIDARRQPEEERRAEQGAGNEDTTE